MVDRDGSDGVTATPELEYAIRISAELYRLIERDAARFGLTIENFFERVIEANAEGE